MSYCVNCGVELAPSERSCPLCGVEVNNPRDPWKEPRRRPYPQTLERVLSGIDRRYGVGLAAMLLLIPALVKVALNLLISAAVTWSLYVVGAILCAFVVVLLPLAFSDFHPFLAICLDIAAVALYVGLICFLSDGDWYAGLALPLVLATGAALFGVTFAFTRKRLGALAKLGWLLLLVGLLTLGIECILGLYLDARWPMWSLLVLLPCLVLAAMLFFIESRQNLKDQIRRRLFY